ncbi:hypothetical protein RSWS8N_16849 [Cereibacter sphaeroides WS8N]|uniref:hypothetical protein n=1 Tax=Cereibacter sphaeroides TaxID=1063 RepID=UPI00020B0185|nr:hypothetical protein [Cereibacter sphaeroides]EGJ19848.1 hypothetical protein RSWS8N_16849 [Cereibacter sphaeroides WS8N]SNS93070.1 hypothetical protein SAMN05421763_103558 [[Luteovulum] sphaeroides subsp. megalophilum]
MLKYLSICLTVAMLLFSMQPSAQVGKPSGCPSTQAVDDVCTAPGPAIPTRAPAEKPCMTCVLPTGLTLALPTRPELPLRLAAGEASAAGRVVPPDRRPPRA